MATHAKVAAHRDRRSPLVISISRLGRSPGSLLTVHESVSSPSRIGLDLIAIDEGAPLDLDLRLESVSEGVLVTGMMSGPTSGQCARCLTPITGHVEVDLTELFAYPDSATDMTTDADEVERVGSGGQADTVDLEQPIIDAVGLALPFAPVCGPDCAGLCPQCGIPLATAEPGHSHEQIDPRWAKLANFDSAAFDTSVRDNNIAKEGMGSRASLLEALGVELPDELLTVTLTHRSYAYENGRLPTNERLEFLGDAVLGLIVSEELFRRHPNSSEGELSRLRNAIVNTHALADVGRKLGSNGLGSHLLLGRGELNTGGSDKTSILADGVEALLGAVYVQHGAVTAREVVIRLFGPLIDIAPTLGAGLEWKTSLQELTSARGLGKPIYSVEATGPDHDREYTATVLVEGNEFGAGVGRSKKEAEQRAAAEAWKALENGYQAD